MRKPDLLYFALRSFSHAPSRNPLLECAAQLDRRAAPPHGALELLPACRVLARHLVPAVLALATCLPAVSARRAATRLSHGYEAPGAQTYDTLAMSLNRLSTTKQTVENAFLFLSKGRKREGSLPF